MIVKCSITGLLNCLAYVISSVISSSSNLTFRDMQDETLLRKYTFMTYAIWHNMTQYDTIWDKMTQYHTDVHCHGFLKSSSYYRVTLYSNRYFWDAMKSLVFYHVDFMMSIVSVQNCWILIYMMIILDAYISYNALKM